jgi:hypothetical protein
MPTCGFSSSMIVPRLIRGGQNLPGARQNTPAKRLKNNKNNPPACFGLGVQGSEAVCETRFWHCGLEIGK